MELYYVELYTVATKIFTLSSCFKTVCQVTEQAYCKHNRGQLRVNNRGVGEHVSIA